MNVGRRDARNEIERVVGTGEHSYCLVRGCDSKEKVDFNVRIPRFK